MKPTSTSRADLLRCMGQGLEPDSAAVVLGYVRVREIEPVRLPEVEAELPVKSDALPPVEEAPVPEIEFPTERPRLTFLMPVRVESLAPPQPRKDRGNPISDAALAVDWSHQGPPLPPLTRWARLAPFLRQRLGTVIPGAALDQRRLMREVGKGLPLVVLPRRPRAAWAAQAVVLWDGTAEMYPFQRDVQDLLRRLRRERGAHGLEVRLLRRLPRSSDAARIPQGVPVIALSAMGQFLQSEAAQEAWLSLARRLGFLGQEFHALNPCPRDRWQPQLAANWPSGVWDRRPRLPRHGGLKVKQTLLSAPAEGTEGQTGVPASISVTDRLLTLLSPASRIEAPLLRTARLALGHAADAGTEWDAWHHEQCWHSLDCFGFHPGADYEARLNRRQALTGREAVLADQIGALMAAHHAGCSSVIAAEAALRAILSGRSETQKGSHRFREARRLASEESAGLPESAGSDSPLGAIKSLLQSVVDRLRLLAADPGGEEGRQSGLPIWFPGMVDRLSESMRAEAEVKKLIAEGLAFSHAFLGTPHVEVPTGVDGLSYKAAQHRIATRPREPVKYWVELANSCLRLTPSDTLQQPPAALLGRLTASRPLVHSTFADGAVQSHRLGRPPAPVILERITWPQPVTLESDLERLHFDAVERRQWMRSLAYDSDGLVATAEVAGTMVRLRHKLPQQMPRSIGFYLALYTDLQLQDNATLWLPEGQTANQPKWAQCLWADDFGIAAGFIIGNIPFVLRWIPPGNFIMGSPTSEVGRYSHEGPQHQVVISAGFWMAETPVTQEQWRAVVEAAGAEPTLWKRLLGKTTLDPAPSHFKALPFVGPENLPVENVTWHGSSAFCQMLNALLPDGPGFHLPTEAQWEFACRAGTKSAFFDGSPCTLPKGKDPALDKLGWFIDNSGSQTHPVKQKLANQNGLHDMHGNIWEWCADAWDGDLYSKRADRVQDPHMDSTDAGAARVVRGGSWSHQTRYCRSAFRFWRHPGSWGSDRGLRLAAGQVPGVQAL